MTLSNITEKLKITGKIDVGDVNKINQLVDRLTSLRDGKCVYGTLHIKKRGRGITGSFASDWKKDIRFRIKKGELQYATHESGSPSEVYGSNHTGWGKEKYGSPLSLLAGNDVVIGYTTKCKLGETYAIYPNAEYTLSEGSL